MTATRFSANACCSGVTPSTPERSIGLVGSYGVAAGAACSSPWSPASWAQRSVRWPGRGVGLAGAVAFEGGEGAAFVRGDPDVHHWDVGAGVDRAGRAGAALVGVGDDLEHGLVVGRPAQVVVDVPLHQRPAVVDECRVVERGLGGVHRRHEGAPVAVDLVDERFRLGRVQEGVVADVAEVEVVLVAAGGVADGAEPERLERGDVGELRQHRQSAGDERLGAGLLVDGDTGDAGEVDRCRRVPRPWPDRLRVPRGADCRWRCRRVPRGRGHRRPGRRMPRAGGRLQRCRRAPHAGGCRRRGRRSCRGDGRLRCRPCCHGCGRGSRLAASPRWRARRWRPPVRRGVPLAPSGGGAGPTARRRRRACRARRTPRR